MIQPLVFVFQTLYALTDRVRVLRDREHEVTTRAKVFAAEIPRLLAVRLGNIYRTLTLYIPADSRYRKFRRDVYKRVDMVGLSAP